MEEPVNAGGNVYGGEEDHHHGGAGGLDNNIFESSGDYSPVTETSAVFTPPTGCRGDSTYTCRESNVQICDEHLCDGVEHCPDGEDELNCGSDDEFNYEKGIVQLSLSLVLSHVSVFVSLMCVCV